MNHEDVLPYISNDSHPIQHELFEKFLTPSGGGIYIIILFFLSRKKMMILILNSW